MKRYGFLILWRGKKYEYWTDDPAIGQYRVKEQFCEEHRIKPGKRWEVSVLLAEKDGQPVVHSTAGL